MLILDEDVEGNITLEEYQHALEAYGKGCEKHVSMDGDEFYVPFDHKAMFKLIKILRERDMTTDELYLMCDVNDDGDINIRELEKVLETLSD